MTAQPKPSELASLTRYAAAAATCADRYAKTFYPMIRDADEKYVCCAHGAEAMQHHQQAAALLAERGVDLTGLVERPLEERGLAGVEALAPEAGETWRGRAAFSALVERAMALQLRGLARSEDAAVAEWAQGALPRQERHAAHGAWLLGQLRRTDADADAEARAAIARLWPMAAALVGEEAQPALLDALRSSLQPLGLSLPGLANPPA